jgi:hypothetical protein
VSQIKPYLFWIFIGAILLLEIAWWILSTPFVDLVGNKAEAQTSKGNLDTEYRHLEDLDKRAKKGSPQGVFDAEREADIRHLTDDYLITPAWKDVLEPHVKRYDQQLTDIKLHLASRSKRLGEPIAGSSDKFAWYTTYQNLTEERLKTLIDAKALALPRAKGAPLAPPRANLPPGAQPPSQADATPAAVALDLASDASIRSIAGFFTKGSDLPDPSEHPMLTTQYRVMEHLIGVVLTTQAANTANTISGIAEAPESSHAAIAGVEWKGRGPAIGGDTGTYATGIALTVTLQGSAATVLATLSAIEHPTDPTAPIVVVTGGDLTRKPNYQAAERKDTGSEVVIGRFNLLVLDFSQASSGVKPAEAKPAPDMGGPGPGMMGAPQPPPPPAPPRGKKSRTQEVGEGE